MMHARISAYDKNTENQCLFESVLRDARLFFLLLKKTWSVNIFLNYLKDQGFKFRDIICEIFQTQIRNCSAKICESFHFQLNLLSMSFL